MNSVVFLQDEPRGPSIIIEVPVTKNGSGRIPLPDTAQLRSTTTQRIILKWMRLVTVDILTRGVILDMPNAPLTELVKISLVVYAEGWEKGQYIPLLSMNDMAVSGGTFPHRYVQTNFNNWNSVDYPKSYLQFCNGTASANSPYVVMLEVGYVKLDAGGNIIEGPSN